MTEVTPSPTVPSPVPLTGPITALPTAPVPFPQASTNLTIGAELYPKPLDKISTPKIEPAALIMAFPDAPEPPPPKNSTTGGPQKTGPTLQVS